jgi:hypothetical protein
LFHSSKCIIGRFEPVREAIAVESASSMSIQGTGRG